MAKQPTRAAEILARSGAPFRLLDYPPDPRGDAVGLHAARALDLDPATAFKTLIARSERGELLCALVPVATRLDLKALAALAGSKKVEMAAPAEAERATGYVTGAISPLGQKRRLRTFLDASALDHGLIYVSGGRRGLELELAPADLVRLSGAASGRISS